MMQTFFITNALDEPGAPSGPSNPSAPEGPGSATRTVGSTAVLEREEQEQAPGDHERYAHYVRKDKAMESAVEGTPVVALCGKVWTPVRNPDRFPICPICKEIYEHLGLGGMGGGTWPFGSQPPQQ